MDDPMTMPAELENEPMPLGPASRRVTVVALMGRRVKQPQGSSGARRHAYKGWARGVLVDAAFKERPSFAHGDSIELTGTIEHYGKIGQIVTASLSDCDAGGVVQSAEQRKANLRAASASRFDELIERSRGRALDRALAEQLLQGGPKGIMEWNRRRADGEEPPDLTGGAVGGALQGANFSRMNLSGVNMAGANLEGVDASTQS
jgi:hypothetical protein